MVVDANCALAFCRYMKVRDCFAVDGLFPTERASGASSPSAMQLPNIRRTRVLGCILPALIAPPTSNAGQFDLLDFDSEA
jgi:hypothetical protein